MPKQGEIQQFRRMVNSLRDEIERKMISHEEGLQKEAQLKVTEFKQLQETIVDLREELEKTHEG